MGDDLQARKEDHLDLCATDRVAFRERTTLLECVALHHQSLPDLALDEVDTCVDLLGKRLSAPIVIAAMTGGTARAREVNHQLARIAARRGYALGLGSQRAMLQDPATADTYRVRDQAPDILLLGNVGVVQARDTDTATLARLVASVGADALCVHMNPAMEMVQPGGDRDFRGGTQTFERLVRELDVPVIAKETGNGVSARTARKLWEAGVRTVDVSGAGGTSWVGVETLRAGDEGRALGEALWDWGIPTAASVHLAGRQGMAVIATGGLKTGLDLARAIALGAVVGGMARTVFKALERAGPEGVDALFDRVERELRAVMLLTGSRTVGDLWKAPRTVTGELARWLA